MIMEGSYSDAKIALLKEKVINVSLLIEKFKETEEKLTKVAHTRDKYFKGLRALHKKYQTAERRGEDLEYKLLAEEKSLKSLVSAVEEKNLKLIQLQQLIDVYKMERSEYGVEKVDRLRNKIKKVVALYKRTVSSLGKHDAGSRPPRWFVEEFGDKTIASGITSPNYPNVLSPSWSQQASVMSADSGFSGSVSTDITADSWTRKENKTDVEHNTNRLHGNLSESKMLDEGCWNPQSSKTEEMQETEPTLHTPELTFQPAELDSANAEELIELVRTSPGNLKLPIKTYSLGKVELFPPSQGSTTNSWTIKENKTDVEHSTNRRLGNLSESKMLDEGCWKPRSPKPEEIQETEPTLHTPELTLQPAEMDSANAEELIEFVWASPGNLKLPIKTYNRGKVELFPPSQGSAANSVMINPSSSHLLYDLDKPFLGFSNEDISFSALCIKQFLEAYDQNVNLCNVLSGAVDVEKITTNEARKPDYVAEIECQIFFDPIAGQLVRDVPSQNNNTSRHSRDIDASDIKPESRNIVEAYKSKCLSTESREMVSVQSPLECFTFKMLYRDFDGNSYVKYEQESSLNDIDPQWLVGVVNEPYYGKDDIRDSKSEWCPGTYALYDNDSLKLISCPGTLDPAKVRSDVASLQSVVEAGPLESSAPSCLPQLPFESSLPSHTKATEEKEIIKNNNGNMLHSPVADDLKELSQQVNLLNTNKESTSSYSDTTKRRTSEKCTNKHLRSCVEESVVGGNIELKEIVPPLLAPCSLQHPTEVELLNTTIISKTTFNLVSKKTEKDVQVLSPIQSSDMCANANFGMEVVADPVQSVPSSVKKFPQKVNMLNSPKGSINPGEKRTFKNFVDEDHQSQSTFQQLVLDSDTNTGNAIFEPLKSADSSLKILPENVEILNTIDTCDESYSDEGIQLPSPIQRTIVCSDTNTEVNKGANSVTSSLEELLPKVGMLHTTEKLITSCSKASIEEETFKNCHDEDIQLINPCILQSGENANENTNKNNDAPRLSESCGIQELIPNAEVLRSTENFTTINSKEQELLDKSSDKNIQLLSIQELVAGANSETEVSGSPAASARRIELPLEIDLSNTESPFTSCSAAVKDTETNLRENELDDTPVSASSRPLSPKVGRLSNSENSSTSNILATLERDTFVNCSDKGSNHLVMDADVKTEDTSPLLHELPSKIDLLNKTDGFNASCKVTSERTEMLATYPNEDFNLPSTVQTKASSDVANTCTIDSPRKAKILGNYSDHDLKLHSFIDTTVVARVSSVSPKEVPQEVVTYNKFNNGEMDGAHCLLLLAKSSEIISDSVGTLNTTKQSGVLKVEIKSSIESLKDCVVNDGDKLELNNRKNPLEKAIEKCPETINSQFSFAKSNCDVQIKPREFDSSRNPSLDLKTVAEPPENLTTDHTLSNNFEIRDEDVFKIFEEMCFLRQMVVVSPIPLSEVDRDEIDNPMNEVAKKSCSLQYMSESKLMKSGSNVERSSILPSPGICLSVGADRNDVTSGIPRKRSKGSSLNSGLTKRMICESSMKLLSIEPSSQPDVIADLYLSDNSTDSLKFNNYVAGDKSNVPEQCKPSSVPVTVESDKINSVKKKRTFEPLIKLNIGEQIELSEKPSEDAKNAQVVNKLCSPLKSKEHVAARRIISSQTNNLKKGEMKDNWIANELSLKHHEYLNVQPANEKTVQNPTSEFHLLPTKSNRQGLNPGVRSTFRIPPSEIWKALSGAIESNKAMGVHGSIPNGMVANFENLACQKVFPSKVTNTNQDFIHAFPVAENTSSEEKRNACGNNFSVSLCSSLEKDSGVTEKAVLEEKDSQRLMFSDSLGVNENQREHELVTDYLQSPLSPEQNNSPSSENKVPPLIWHWEEQGDIISSPAQVVCHDSSLSPRSQSPCIDVDIDKESNLVMSNIKNKRTCKVFKAGKSSKTRNKSNRVKLKQLQKVGFMFIKMFMKNLSKKRVRKRSNLKSKWTVQDLNLVNLGKVYGNEYGPSLAQGVIKKKMEYSLKTNSPSLPGFDVLNPFENDCSKNNVSRKLVKCSGYTPMDGLLEKTHALSSENSVHKPNSSQKLCKSSINSAEILDIECNDKPTVFNEQTSNGCVTKTGGIPYNGESPSLLPKRNQKLKQKNENKPFDIPVRRSPRFHTILHPSTDDTKRVSDASSDLSTKNRLSRKSSTIDLPPRVHTVLHPSTTETTLKSVASTGLSTENRLSRKSSTTDPPPRSHTVLHPSTDDTKRVSDASSDLSTKKRLSRKSSTIDPPLVHTVLHPSTTETTLKSVASTDSSTKNRLSRKSSTIDPPARFHTVLLPSTDDTKRLSDVPSDSSAKKRLPKKSSTTDSPPQSYTFSHPSIDDRKLELDASSDSSTKIGLTRNSSTIDPPQRRSLRKRPILPPCARFQKSAPVSISSKRKKNNEHQMVISDFSSSSGELPLPEKNCETSLRGSFNISSPTKDVSSARSLSPMSPSLCIDEDSDKESNLVISSIENEEDLCEGSTNCSPKETSVSGERTVTNNDRLVAVPRNCKWEGSCDYSNRHIPIYSLLNSPLARRKGVSADDALPDYTGNNLEPVKLEAREEQPMLKPHGFYVDNETFSENREPNCKGKEHNKRTDLSSNETRTGDRRCVPAGQQRERLNASSRNLGITECPPTRPQNCSIGYSTRRLTEKIKLNQAYNPQLSLHSPVQNPVENMDTCLPGAPMGFCPKSQLQYTNIDSNFEGGKSNSGESLLDGILSAMKKQSEEIKLLPFLESNPVKAVPKRRKKKKIKKKVAVTHENLPAVRSSNPNVQNARRILDSFLLANNSTSDEAASSLKNCVESLLRVSKPDLVRAILTIVLENVEEELDYKFTPPAPPLTPTQQRLFALFAASPQLISLFPNILKEIEHQIFPEQFFWPDDTLDSCGRFYTALCRHMKKREPPFRLCMDALVNMSQRGHILIKAILLTWTELLPSATLVKPYSIHYTIAFLIMQIPRVARKPQEAHRIMLRKFVQNILEYKCEETKENFVKGVISSVSSGDPGSMEALTILAKIFKWRWASLHIVKPLLERIGGRNDMTDAVAIRFIGALKNILEGFPQNDMKANTAVKGHFKEIGNLLLSKTVAHEVEERLVELILYLDAFGNASEILTAWIPQEPVAPSLESLIVAHTAKSKGKKRKKCIKVNRVVTKCKTY